VCKIEGGHRSVSHFITSLTALIQNFYTLTGLAGVALAMVIESCCIPLPSEIIMPLAGAMLALSSQAGAKHLLGVDPGSPLWLNLVLLALAGSIGSLVGSILAYGIGYAGGRPLLLKYGKYVLISQHDSDKADHFFQRWGAATAFFSRLLPVVRTYISLPAGMAKMPFAKFCTYTFLGSLPWCVALAYAGYLLGNNYNKLSQPLHYVDGLIVVLFVLLVVLYIWRHIRNDRRARAEHVAAGTAGQTPVAANPWGQPPFSTQSPATQSPNLPTYAQQPQSGNQPVRTFTPPQSQQSQGNNQPGGNNWR
jgi:membrane protein DedA with SNARE-associated domain